MRSLLCFLLLTLCAAAQGIVKPNILIFYADDLGWQDTALNQHPEDAPACPWETPNMTALAADGINFQQGYSPQGLCAPSRVSLLNGWHPARNVKTNVEGGTPPRPGAASTKLVQPYWKARMEYSDYTIAEALRDAGYFTGHIAKWHCAIGHNSSPTSAEQGFEFTFTGRGVTNGMANRYTYISPGVVTGNFATAGPADPYVVENPGAVGDRGERPYDAVTENAIAFIAESVNPADPDGNGRPFFLYLAHWLVHTPIHQRDEVLLKYYCAKLGYDYDGTGTPGNTADDFNQFIDGNGNWTVQGQKNPFYGAMVDTLDWSLGKIVAYLKATDDPRNPGYKLYETTYIFFTSDNGGMEAAGDQITDNAPLKSGKIHIDEGGVRVPFVVAGPGISGGGVSQEIVTALDFYPTILALTGAPGRASQNAHLDGVNLDPYLKGAETRVNDPNGNLRDALYFHFPHGGESRMKSSVRQGDFKLYKNYLTSDYSLYRLYDNGVRTDWEEAADLIGNPAHSATKEAMIAKLEAFLIETDAQPPYWNVRNTSLPNQSLVPAITGESYDPATNTAAVTFETAGKAAVDRAYLLYTLNGGLTDEEWFQIPASVSAGTASAQVPLGTTHYVFNLIDANNFLRSSVDFNANITPYSSQVTPFDPYNDSDNLYFLPGRAQPAETLGIWHMDGSEFGSGAGQLEETGEDALGQIGRSDFGFMGSALELTASAGSGNQSAVSLITDDFSSGTVATTGLVFSQVGAGRTQSTGTWAVSGGALANTGNGAAGDRALAWAIDVSGLSADLDGLDLAFNYNASTAGEKLYVHLYGYIVENTPDAGSSMLNLGATNGNAWTIGVDSDIPESDKFSITNLITGDAQGTVAPYRGDAAGAFEITGTTGLQSFSRHFDLSSITSGGPANLGGYDYLVLAFARESNTDGSLTIDNVQLTAVPYAGAVPVPVPGRVRVSGSQTPGTYFPTAADPSLTLETWVKFNEVNAVADQCILDKSNGSGGYQLKLLAGTDQLAIRFGNATTTSGATGIVAGRWYHVAATWNGPANTAKIYLNGVEVASQQHAGAGVLTDSGSYLTFGNAAVTAAPFNGCLDEVRLSATAYTFANQPEFPPLYDPADPDTLAIYRMESAELGTGAGDLVIGPADGEHISFEIAEGFSGTALKNAGLSGTDKSRITVKDSASGAAGIFPAGSDPSLCVEAWVRFDQINTPQDQFIFSSVSSNGYNLAMTAGSDALRSQFRIGGTSHNLTTAATGITPGSWHHVAITWNGATNTSKIFLDFKQLATAQPAGADVIANGEIDLTIGNHAPTTQARPLEGMIDSLRIRSIAHEFDPADAVVSETAAYAAWQQNHFDTNDIASGWAGRTVDPDGDGFTNEQEFLFNFNPLDPANLNLPWISIETEGAAKYPTFSFTPAIGSGINYFVDWSSDLEQWSTGELNVDLFMLPGSPVNNGDGSETIRLRYKDDTATTPKLFFRLRAQEP